MHAHMRSSESRMMTRARARARAEGNQATQARSARQLTQKRRAAPWRGPITMPLHAHDDACFPRAEASSIGCDLLVRFESTNYFLDL